jgi:hypothetical protein
MHNPCELSSLCGALGLLDAAITPAERRAAVMQYIRDGRKQVQSNNHALSHPNAARLRHVLTDILGAEQLHKHNLAGALLLQSGCEHNHDTMWSYGLPLNRKPAELVFCFGCTHALCSLRISYMLATKQSFTDTNRRCECIHANIVTNRLRSGLQRCCV